jgi:hypothetical protein
MSSLSQIRQRRWARPAISHATQLWILFAVGLLFRLAVLGVEGTNDMRAVLGWGDGVRQSGLVAEYHGIYFPFAYLIFAGVSWLRDLFGVSGFAVLKAVTLASDVGAFLCLVHLLRAWGLDRRYALIYWLHPFFLSAFELGYIDAHLAVCVLATLVLLLNPTPLRTIAAGVPLGFGLLMKPQMIPIVGMTIVFALLVMVLTRSLRPLPQLVRLILAPACLLVGVSVYFALDGANISTVAFSYKPSELAHQSAGLTGNMLNIWYPVAALAREGSQPVYDVARPAAANTVGAISGIALLLAGAIVVARRHRALTTVALLELWALTAAVVPLVLTHAHENHFFLAGTLGALIVARRGDARLTVLLCALLAVQFVNLFLLYGLGLTHLTETTGLRAVTDTYRSWVGLQTGLAVVVVVLAVPWLVQLFRPRPATTSI